MYKSRGQAPANELDVADVGAAGGEEAAPLSGGQAPRCGALEPAWFNDVPVALLGLNNNEQLVCANRLAVALLGLGDVDWFEQPVQGILNIASSLRAELHASKAEVYTRRVTLRAGGAHKQASLSIRRLFDGGPLHYICSISMIEAPSGDCAELRDDLAGMGQMIARCAHEIRNPLAALTSILQDLSTGPDPCLVAQPDVSRMSVLVARLDRLARSSLRLVQSEVPIRKDVEAAALVESALEILEPRLRALGGASIARDGVHDGAFARVDEQQIVQVLVIVLDNALDAAGSASGVRVRARTEPAPSGDRADHGGAGALGGRGRVLIDIEDDGPGMPPEVITKIFSPFFTRKLRGTGLGLSIAQKLVRENNGRIWVRSSPGRGSIFSVDLPGAFV